MSEKQLELLEKMRDMNSSLSKISTEYWKEFSSFNDLKFWVVILMLVIPLIILFWKIDRTKMLLLGFYGFNYHMWFAYTNSAAIRMGYCEYPYEVLPILPSFALDASLVPVCYMFVYQWTLNRNKSFYLYSFLMSAVFAFIMKPLLVAFDLFHMYKGWNYFYLFLFYVGLFIVSKVITNIFIRMQKGKESY